MLERLEISEAEKNKTKALFFMSQTLARMIITLTIQISERLIAS